MKEFSDSLPASELEHFWLNMFNYLRKYICVHPSSINLNGTRQRQFPIFFTYSLFISVTKKFSFNILKTISLKIEKKTSIETQSEGHTLVHKTSKSYLADWQRQIQKRCSTGREKFRRLQSSYTAAAAYFSSAEGASFLGGSGGMPPPPKIWKFRCLEMLFSTFSRQYLGLKNNQS